MDERIIAAKYRLIAAIGRGGMAAVYRAEHLQTGKFVALKLLHLEEGAAAPGRTDITDETRELIGRFEREARAAGSMETDHIVKVYDAGVDETSGAPYIAMELLEGRDLNQLMKELTVLSPEVAVRIVGQALTGLAQAHKAGIVHRDLKPANIFVDERPGGVATVKLVDFGIAKVQVTPIATMDTHGLTQTGSMLGTPRYMSPEQIERPRMVDARSDVWSMGVVLYKCLTGRCPHDDTETLGAMLMALMTKPSPPVQSLAPWVPAELARLVHKALERDPSRRYASAVEMLEAMRALSEDGFLLRAAELVPLDEERRAMLGSLVPPGPTDSQAPATIDQRGTLDTGTTDKRPKAKVAEASPKTPRRPLGTVVSGWGAGLGMGVISTLALVTRPFQGKGPRPKKFKPFFRPHRGRSGASWRTSLREGIPAFTAIFAFLVLGLGAWMVIRASALPPAKGVSAPPDEVSADRAAAELNLIAGDGVPRPTGSIAATRVRGLLRERLKTLGYTPIDQDTLVCGGTVGCSYVHNVLARTRDPGSGGMTLVVTHYDSVAAGPGAGDDGSGVAIALEVARLLAAAPLPATSRAVGFLFDEGEEDGLFGATAFVEQHPWMRDVRSVVNLEARGTSGDSLLFEVIGDSDAVSRAAASSLAHPVTSSLLATIYARMPNSTDLTVFRAHGGVTGANLAFIGGGTRYHTARDAVDQVDRRTLQAQGDNAFALVRAFSAPSFAPAAGSPTASEGAPSTWFDVLHRTIVRVSLELTWGFAGLAVVLALVALVRVKPTLSAIVRALFALLFAPILAAGLSTVVLAGARAAGFVPATFVADPTYMLVAFVGLAVVTLAFAGALSRYARDGNTEIPSQMAWLLLAAVGAAGAYFAPGTAYLFALPALAASLVRVVAPGSAHLAEAAGGFVLAVLATSLVLSLYDALGFDLAAALVVPPVLLLLPFAPLLAGVARPVAVLGALAVIGGVVMARRTPAFTVDAPERVNVIYTRDPGRAAATIGVDAAWYGHASGPVPEAMRAALGPNAAPATLLPWERHAALRVDTDAMPAGEESGPALPEGLSGAVRVETIPTVDGAHIADDLARPMKSGRTVRVRLTAPPTARTIGLMFPEPTALRSVTLEGQDWPAVERGSGDTQFRMFVLHAPGESARTKGLDVVLTLDGAEVVEGRVFALASGVPPVARAVVDARPASASPSQDGDSSWVWTSQKF
jgi:serine/threonine protein kinase